MSVAPIVLCAATVLFTVWPARLAVIHLLALTLLGGGLAEWSLASFRKVPFTCSYLPGKANGHTAFWLAVLFLIPVANELARMEARLLGTEVGGVLLICALGAVWAVARWRSQTHAVDGAQLIFEEQIPPEIFSLKLDRG